jgi:hypothetical protein
MPKLYNTREAARRMGIGHRTLNRWILLGRIKASQGVPIGGGRTLHLWTLEDIERGREIKKHLKPGFPAKGKQ